MAIEGGNWGQGLGCRVRFWRGQRVMPARRIVWTGDVMEEFEEVPFETVDQLSWWVSALEAAVTRSTNVDFERLENESI